MTHDQVPAAQKADVVPWDDEVGPWLVALVDLEGLVETFEYLVRRTMNQPDRHAMRRQEAQFVEGGRAVATGEAQRRDDAHVAFDEAVHQGWVRVSVFGNHLLNHARRVEHLSRGCKATWFMGEWKIACGCGQISLPSLRRPPVIQAQR